jgi:hypothetical protein
MRKMQVILTTVVIFALCISSVVMAQDNDDEGEGDQTIEELYLQSAEIGLIREQAVTIDRDMKLLALENLERLVDDGKIQQDSADALYLLDYLATEGTTHEVRVNGRLINNYPIVRKEACELLGRVGGETAKESLLTVLRQENEPMVMSEAVYALGKIGLNDDGQVANLLAEQLSNQTVVAPDDNFAFATLLAFEKLAEANNGIRSPAVYSVLVEVAQGNYIDEVQEKALQVMDKLRTYR